MPHQLSSSMLAFVITCAVVVGAAGCRNEAGAQCSRATDCDDGDECTLNECTDDKCAFPIDTTRPDCEGTACNSDTKCDGNEGCDCADCAAACACTGVTLVDVPAGTSFVEGTVSAIDGAASDSLQGFGFGGLQDGTSVELVRPDGFADCNTAPCFAIAADGGAKFYGAVSGVIDVETVSPMNLTLRHLVFQPRTTDVSNNFVYDDAGVCFHLDSGSIPTL